jgi:Caspase domain
MFWLSPSRAVIRLTVFAIGVAWSALALAATEPALRGADNGQVRALVIGIDAYRHVRPLKGAVPDARDIEKSLRGMGVGDLTTLIDDQADRAAVLRELEHLVQRSGQGDLVILSIAGHGAQEPEHVKGSQPDGMDSVFLLPEFQITPAGSRERIIGTEFHHFIKMFEAKGARVLFIADTCHGGGMVREIDPRAEEMSFRQVPRYTIPVDQLKPVATNAEAFLTELDFDKTAFLAAVDRRTKAPEVRIPGIAGFRGALSYAFARAIEGQADTNGDGKITLRELFTDIKQIVYQLSDQRQNPVTLSSPSRDIDTEVVFELTRSVTIIEGLPDSPPRTNPPAQPPAPAPAPSAGPAPAPVTAPVPALAPIRIASVDGQNSRFTGLQQLEAPFEVVAKGQNPDLLWDATSGDVLAGGDVIAYHVALSDLPSVIDRAAAVRGLKLLATKTPQPVKVLPDDKVHHSDAAVAVEVGGVGGRALLVFNIAGDGTVQALYPIGSDPPIMRDAEHRLPVRVRGPFGADQIIAVTSQQRMTALEDALKQLSQRRTAVQILRAIQRYGPKDARIGSTAIFTAP